MPPSLPFLFLRSGGNVLVAIKCCVCVDGQIRHIFECGTMKDIEAVARFLSRQSVSYVILFEGEFSNV